MKLHISPGNRKIGRCPNISLPPVISCPVGISCAVYCYAQGLYQAYKQTKIAWHENFELWKNDPGQFFTELEAFLRKKHPQYFRYHIGGDIPDARYLDMMIYLARLFPYIRFLDFTKTKAISPQENLVIVKSHEIDASFFDQKLDRPNAFILRKYQLAYETYICPGKCVSCGHKCWYLHAGESVAFHIHGSVTNPLVREDKHSKKESTYVR